MLFLLQKDLIKNKILDVSYIILNVFLWILITVKILNIYNFNIFNDNGITVWDKNEL